jgi:hypothetical protein
MRTKFPANDLLRRLAQDRVGREHGDRGNNATDNRNQASSPFDTSDHADHAIPGVLDRSDVSREVFRHSDRIEHFHGFPQSKVRKEAYTTAATICGNYFAQSSRNRIAVIQQKLTVARFAA